MYVIATQSQKALLRTVENLNLLMAYLLTIQLSVFTFGLMQLSSVVGDRRGPVLCLTEAGNAYKTSILGYEGGGRKMNIPVRLAGEVSERDAQSWNVNLPSTQEKRLA